MRRMQDSNLKEIRRLTNLLLKIKRYERQKEESEETDSLQDVWEKKELVIISQIDENRMLMNVIELVDAIVVGVRKKGVKIELHLP